MKKKEEKQKQHSRKFMSLANKTAPIFLIVLTVYLAIILPIKIYIVAFSWHWFVFGLIALIIPFAVINLQLAAQRVVSFSNEQKKNAKLVTVRYILYFWLLDCLYMAIFNQWTVWVYIIGIIALIKIFYSLTVAFLGKKQKNLLFDFSLVFDFLLGMVLTVYLIFLIPDKFAALQTKVTNIVAATYGGLLTLVGVAWTIKHSENQRMTEERRKSEPLFSYVYKKIEPSKCIVISSRNFSGLENKCGSFESQEGVLIYRFTMENSSKIEFFIRGMIVNGFLYEMIAKELVRKEYGVIFDMLNLPLQAVDDIKLYVEDVLGNLYAMQLLFSNDNGNIQIIGNKPIQYIGCRS